MVNNWADWIKLLGASWSDMLSLGTIVKTDHLEMQTGAKIMTEDEMRAIEEAILISEAMRLLGKRTSEAKKVSSRENGKRPKRKKATGKPKANG